jgi:Fibronectin type III domain
VLRTINSNNVVDYYARHGIVVSDWLTLHRIFSDLVEWAQAGGRGQEIIMVNLAIDQGGGPFPVNECAFLYQNLGSNWVTPDMLLDAFRTADPGEVTLGQLWSLPITKQGVARIIIDNQQCNQAADAGAPPWGPILPPGGLFSGYYADQCFAGPDPDGAPNQAVGVSPMVNAAAELRSSEGNGDFPIPLGPSQVGGLYNLFINGTPDGNSCLYPSALLQDERDVLNSLTGAWSEFEQRRQAVLNVVSADFVGDDQLDLVDNVMLMNLHPTLPAPPAPTGLTSGPGQVIVAFSAPTDQGTAPITSYTVTAWTPSGGGQQVATGPSSPITVFGLTNRTQYYFTVAATNAAGTGQPSGSAGPITVGATPPKILDGPAASGVVGQLYDSQFSVSGTPTPTVTLVTERGAIWPPGLILQSSGEVKGFPTVAGTFPMFVQATNPYGSALAQGSVTISPKPNSAETTVPQHPETSWQRMDAKICTKGAKDRPECASRLLFGPFPRLEDRAAVSLVRGPVTYATGHVTGDGKTGDRKLTLRGRCGLPSERQCEVPFGRYTLVLHRNKHRSTFVPVTLH